MNNKIIILSLTIFFIASFFYLAYVEQNRRGEGNFWTSYFEDPKSGSLNFVIENHSNETNFHWEILADKDKIRESDIKVTRDAKEAVNVPKLNTSSKITIVVSDGENRKEIYKNL